MTQNDAAKLLNALAQHQANTRERINGWDYQHDTGVCLERGIFDDPDKSHYTQQG